MLDFNVIGQKRILKNLNHRRQFGSTRLVINQGFAKPLVGGLRSVGRLGPSSPACDPNPSSG